MAEKRQMNCIVNWCAMRVPSQGVAISIMTNTGAFLSLFFGTHRADIEVVDHISGLLGCHRAAAVDDGVNAVLGCGGGT